MKPLILDYATKRKGEVAALYQYDFMESINVIKIDDKKKAFIDSSSDDVSLLTKTKIERESDDTSLSLLELKTKTEAARERDDYSSSLLELQTKTLVSKERDDQSFNNF